MAKANRGGNSKNRRTSRREGESHPPMASTDFYRPSLPHPARKRWSPQVLQFVEQPLVLGALGVMAGIVGTVVLAPVLYICGLCLFAAFHRQGSVRDKRWYVKVLTYLIVLFAALTLSHVVVKIVAKHNPHVLTTDDLKAVILQSGNNRQPTVVIQAPTTPPVVQPPKEYPIITVGETSAEHNPEDRKTTLHVTLTNSTGVSTKIAITSSATIDGQPIDTVVDNMPRRDTVFPPHSNQVLNMKIITDSGDKDKAIWQGQSTLEIAVVIKYEQTSYQYIGRLNPEGKYLATIVSESSRVRR